MAAGNGWEVVGYAGVNGYARKRSDEVAKIQKAVRTVAGAPVGFLRGLAYPFRGMRFVYLQHPGLIRYWIVPIGITIAAVVAAVTMSWHYSDAVTNLVWEQPTGDGWLNGLLMAVHNVVDVVVFVALLATSLFVLVSLSTAIAAPFNSALSAEVERIVTGRAPPNGTFGQAFRDVWRTIALELLKMTIYLGVMAPMFFCSFLIPVVGQVAYSVFGFLFTAFYFGVDFLDSPAERRGMGARQRLSYARGRFLSTLGLGSGVWVFLFVPFLNLVFMPAAVAGGTLMFLDMEGAHTDTAA